MHSQTTTATHEYAARLIWTGNRGDGTASYATYGRDHRVLIAGKPDLVVSADAMFRGDAALHNPEDLFLAAVAGCHMLEYLALCARRHVMVVAYEDEPRGTLALNPDRTGRFSEIVLSPVVTIPEGADAELALKLHETAHAGCYIANSCSVPIHHRATVRTAAAGPQPSPGVEPVRAAADGAGA